MRIASLGDASVVHDLAELLSLCARLRAEAVAGDGAAWAATVCVLGAGDPRLGDARAALRDEADTVPALALAAEVAGPAPAEQALALHRGRVD